MDSGWSAIRSPEHPPDPRSTSANTPPPASRRRGQPVVENVAIAVLDGESAMIQVQAGSGPIILRCGNRKIPTCRRGPAGAGASFNPRVEQQSLRRFGKPDQIDPGRQENRCWAKAPKSLLPRASFLQELLQKRFEHQRVVMFQIMRAVKQGHITLFGGVHNGLPIGGVGF